MLKILDQIPIWKTLRTLPGRVDALEKRLDALQAAPTTAPGQPCAACGAPALRRTSRKPSLGPFGALGAQDEIWTCTTCGATEERNGVR